MAVGSYEGVPYGPLVRSRPSQPESGDYALGVHNQSHLEAVDPLGLGGAPPEGSLTAEEALARSPHPHDGRHERRVHHAIDGRRTGEFLGEGSLQLAQLGLQGSDAPIELALGAQHGEVRAQVRRSEAPEVPLAAEAGPLSEDGQGEDFRVGEQGRTAGLRCARTGDGARATSRPRARTMRPRGSRDPSWGTTFGRRFGTSIRVSAPSPSSRITHQPS